MELNEILRSVLRRWPIVVVVAVLGVILAMSSGGSPDYLIEGEILLISPVDAVNANPVLATNTTVNSAASLASVVVESDEFRDAFLNAGLSPLYEFSVERRVPYASLELVASSAEHAIDSANAIAGLFIEEMSQQQLRFDADAQALGSAELLGLSDPVADNAAVWASRGMIVVVMLILGIVVAALVDGVIRSTRSEPATDSVSESVTAA